MASIVLSAEYHCNFQQKSVHYHDCHQILYIAGGSATRLLYLPLVNIGSRFPFTFLYPGTN